MLSLPVLSARLVATNAAGHSSQLSGSKLQSPAVLAAAESESKVVVEKTCS